MAQFIKTVRWSDYIRYRLSRNSDFRAVLIGPPGVGKSYACLSIAEEIDVNFDIRNVVFTPLELMERINSGELKKGACLIVEECGVQQNSRQWYSLFNRVASFLWQTMRSLNYCVLMNTPSSDFIDSQVKKTLTAQFEVLGIDWKTNQCVIKPKLIQYNSVTGKAYFKYLRLKSEGKMIPISKLRVNKPTDTLCAQYEAKKAEYLGQLNSKLLDELKQAEGKQKAKSEQAGKSKQIFLTEKQQSVLTLLEKGHKVDAIADTLKLSKITVYKHIGFMRRKGVNFPVVDGCLTFKPPQEGSV